MPALLTPYVVSYTRTRWYRRCSCCPSRVNHVTASSTSSTLYIQSNTKPDRSCSDLRKLGMSSPTSLRHACLALLTSLLEKCSWRMHVDHNSIQVLSVATLTSDAKDKDVVRTSTKTRSGEAMQ